jgi:hypothetical protein
MFNNIFTKVYCNMDTEKNENLNDMILHFKFVYNPKKLQY